MRNIDLCNEYIKTSNPEFLFDINPVTDDVILLRYTGVGDVVEIPSFVTVVGSKVFSGIIGDSLTVIWRDCKCDSLSYMFENTQVDELIVNINTTDVKRMAGMFNSSKCRSIELGDMFNTSNVTDMSMMFNKCMWLKELHLGDKFDTSNVQNGNHMFACCEDLEFLDLGSKFNFNAMCSTVLMFYGMDKLKTVVVDCEIPKDARKTVKGGIVYKSHTEED